MQDPPFWVSTIHPLYGYTRPHVWDLHFWLGHDSNTICNDPVPTVQILFTLDPYPSWFCSPLKHTIMGKKLQHIKRRAFFINTFSCTSLSDVKFYRMQDLSFWITIVQYPLFITPVYNYKSQILLQLYSSYIMYYKLGLKH